jgi:hypothetical protein
MEKKYLIINLFTFLISFVTFSQVTFDFKTSQDPLGWVKAGGAQAATIVADGLAISWLGDANKVPKLKIDNANIDADLYKIIAITLINNSTEIERVRPLHFKGATGTDPSSANGANTRYSNIDLNAGTSSEIYYFNLTNTEWTNYNAASNDDADSDMDHISLLFTTITNGGLNIASTSGDVILEKIEFLESIPSAPRNDFDFNDTSDSEGFVGGNGVVLSQPTAGEVNLEISDDSPYPKFEQTGLFSVDADTYGGVEITLINNSPKNSLSFVSPSGGNQFVAKSMNSNDPNPQTISLNLKNATNWTGEQTSWWLQLVDNQGDGAQVSTASIQIQQILFVNEVLDTDSFEQESIKISFSPNPVKSLLNISSSRKVDKVEVFNILGQKSSVQNILDNTVNFSSLPTGVYMIKVYQGNEIITTKKIIKN